MLLVAVMGTNSYSTEPRLFGVAFDIGGIYVELPIYTALGQVTRSDRSDILRFRSMDPVGKFGSAIVAYNFSVRQDLIPLPVELDLTACTISASGAVFRFYVSPGEDDRRWATVSSSEMAMSFSSSGFMTTDDVLSFMPEESWQPISSDNEELLKCDREHFDAAYRVPRRAP